MKLPKELEELKSLCFVCNKRLFLTCGQPKVVVGGCCVGAEWGKTIHMFPRSAHYGCYRKLKKSPKLFLKEKEVKSKLSIYNKSGDVLDE